MQADFTRLKRRPFFIPLLMPLAFLAVAVAVALWLMDARNSTVIVLVRHGEIAQLETTGSSLSAAGQARAAALVKQLSLAKPARGVDAIYVAEGAVNQQTAAPLAQQMGLAVNVVASGDWQALPSRIARDHPGELVVVIAAIDGMQTLLSEYTDPTLYPLDAQDYGSLLVIAKSRLSKPAIIRLRY